MNPKTLMVYDYYEDIQPKLCEYMGIEKEYFRKYHLIDGGEYKDLWHVFLNIHDHTFRGNDSYFVMYDDESESVDDMYVWEYYLNQYPEHEWAIPLFKALNRLHLEYGRELVVWISW